MKTAISNRKIKIKKFSAEIWSLKNLKWLFLLGTGSLMGITTCSISFGLTLALHLFMPRQISINWALHIFTAILVVANIGIWIIGIVRCRPRKLDLQRKTNFFAKPLIHYTTHSALASMLQDGLSATGQADVINLLPSKIDRFFGLAEAAYCFSGEPSKLNRVVNVGIPEVIVVIDPKDVRGEVKYRLSDNAIMLIGGYLGPATWQSLTQTD